MPGAGAPQGAGQEVPLLMRRWLGVNLADDPIFIGPDYLQKAQNFIPAPTFALTKRPGTAGYLTLGTGFPWVTAATAALLRVYDNAGNRYLYAYVMTSEPADRLLVSLNDANATIVGGPLLGAIGARGGLAAMNGVLYAGNGVDPLLRVPLGGAATSLAALALANDTGQAAVAANDANSALVTGQYAYRWAIYDTGTKQWTAVGPVQVVTVSGRQSITFTAPQAGAPATVLGANQKWHCFVTAPNAPIETAHDLTPVGLAAAGTIVMANPVPFDATPVPVPSTVMRTGRFLVPHRGRLFLGGDQNAGRSRNVYATSVLIPGLEQAIYDQGDFFPANAIVLLDDDVTGIVVVTLTTTQQSPSSPLAVFTNNTTWLFLGDILDDPNAQLLQLSDHVGCVAHATLAATPIGVIFLANDSVYLLRPDFGPPVDIGWPIAPVVRACPVNERPFAWATYHKGFYKLALTSPGGAENGLELWLDLRPRVRDQALGGTPSWWGPHVVGTPMTCAATGQRDPLEDDRGFGAVEGNGAVVLLQQPTSFADGGVAVSSVLRTARLDGGDPFSHKRVMRARCQAKVSVPTTVNLQALLDGGLPSAGAWNLQVGAGAVAWNVAWNVNWGGPDMYEEADTNGATPAGVALGVPFAGTPQGQSVELQLDHAVASDLTLRDLEIRAQVFGRAVA
jgi:hypothetical protein